MTATRFNVLDAARALEAAGVDRRQADAIAGGIRDGANADLATKADLHTAIATLATTADLGTIRTELRNEIHRNNDTLRSEIRLLLGILAALILATVARLFEIV